ncbi:MAG TPA: UDP-glucose 6-dehydrogenase, partial [Gammaproteobacteria bacterium]|nr:UDP-glucose 6-dehydrogenase [Gammaproteobacteria bacterium]
MNLTIVGTGYVGLVTGTCFAEMGNNVTCVDIDEAKLAQLREGIVLIHEPGLESLVHDNLKAGRLNFSNDIGSSINDSEVTFIAVGTPPKEDGSADLSHVETVARSIGQSMVNPMVIVNKSTVPVGTAEKVRAVINEALEARNADVEFDVISNPEFLREGNAIKDFMFPDRIVVGTDNQKSQRVMDELYGAFAKKEDRIQYVGIRDAEMIKYAANAMLATKISFMNEVSVMCDEMAIDVENVRRGVGSDERIGSSFMYPGCGYGG